MSTNVPNNLEDQEIDLSKISKEARKFSQEISKQIYKGIRFIIKNGIVITLFLLTGFGLGLYLDETNKIYSNEITVTPNFGSTDYLYTKIHLINSKIIDGDTLFLKNSIGLKNPKIIKSIKIWPVVDVFKFIEDKPENFQLIKLMAEEGNIKDIVLESMTSKNYKYHKISLITNGLVDNIETVQPLLDFLNDTDHYEKIQHETINNIQIKMVQNDTIISQINDVLNGFSNKGNRDNKRDNLVYYNENTQLNDIITTKEALIKAQGEDRINLIGFEKIVLLNSSVLNIQNKSLFNGRQKMALPFVFISGFFLLVFCRRFYENQKAAHNIS
jgi:hypothetical protein